MKQLPGELQRYTLYNDKLPEQEYDPQGIPYGIQPDYERPYLDSKGNKRNVLMYRPKSLKPMLLARAMFILADETQEEGVASLLTDCGLLELAERDAVFLLFPLPTAAGWNTKKDAALPDDVDIINQVLLATRLWYLFTGREKCHEYTMCMTGVGKGAEMAHVATAEHPEYIHSLLTFGGTLTEQTMPDDASDAGMFVWTVNQIGEGYRFWHRANGLENTPDTAAGTTVLRKDAENAARQVRRSTSRAEGIDGAILTRFWDEALCGNVRIPDTGNGSVFSCTEILQKYEPCEHKNDRSLGDNARIGHNWYEFVPDSVIGGWRQENRLCPLLIEMHGGGSWPLLSAAKTQLQALGEKEGFITVYANATEKNSWNSVMRDDRKNDVEYITALIEHLKRCYPIDPARVYISGFSNGSGMAHVMAALRPDLIAGLMAFNTRFQIHDLVYQRAKNGGRFDYRMPVFSTYGTKDAEYPMQTGCGQFTQMQLWKWFNNIELRPLDPGDASGVGTPGDDILTWGRYGCKGDPIFTTHIYRSRDEGRMNYYNYTLVTGLPHTVERRLIGAAWAYLSQFSRMPDGSLKYEKREDSIL